MPSTKRSTESAIDRFVRETVNIVNATLCTPEVRSRGLDEDIVQDIWVAFLERQMQLAPGLSVVDAMYAIDEGHLDPGEGAVMGSFYHFVLNLGRNARRRHLRLARRNESGEWIEDDEPDKSRRSYEDDEDVLAQVKKILDHFDSTEWNGENGYVILTRIHLDGEARNSVAESLGSTASALSSWLWRESQKLREQHTKQE